MHALRDGRPVVITGVTTTGKTDVAWDLARRIGTAAVITTVPFYMHARWPFHYGIGLTPTEPPIDIHTYLYKSRDPRSPKPSDDTVVGWIRQASDDAKARGLLPILEGASPNVTRAILDAIDVQTVFILHRPGRISHVVDIRRRVAKVAELLVDEVQQVDAAGLQDTWLATYGDVYEPARQCAHGEITQNEMVDRITAFMTRLAIDDDKRLAELIGENVYRVPCGAGFRQRTIAAIEMALEIGTTPDLARRLDRDARPTTGTSVEILPAL